MFLDQASIHVSSGAGGNGMVAWRREKFVSHGGPAGGDGGRGGSVYVEATDNLNTLLDFKYQSIFKADDGEKGRIKNQHGHSGKDLIIKVPCGTVIRDAETQEAIADLTHNGERALVAQGGRGGRGNSRFHSSTRQAPQFAEPGEPGIERQLLLELKLIADVGIIGFPNAGKSTLISVISAAKPKIADYPFTTLTPNLGVVKRGDGRQNLVVADIPGLIEGASEGVGLGHDFLRHIERTRLLLHVVDLASGVDETGRDPLARYDLINQELCQYSEKLSQKPQILVLSKIDALMPEEREDWQQRFTSHLPEGTVLKLISSVTHEGIEALLPVLFDAFDALPPTEEVVDVVADYKAFDNDDSAFEVLRDGQIYEVKGGKIGRLVGITDLKNREAVFRLKNILKSMGVFDALNKAGAQEGDTIRMGEAVFDYLPE